jgi:hypothetical protein
MPFAFALPFTNSSEDRSGLIFTLLLGIRSGIAAGVRQGKGSIISCLHYPHYAL